MANLPAPAPVRNNWKHPRVSESNSCRQILRSSWIIGGASVVNIPVSLERTKVAAFVLGRVASVNRVSIYTLADTCRQPWP